MQEREKLWSAGSNQWREMTLPAPLESSMRNTTTVNAYVGYPRKSTKRWMKAISTMM